MSRSTWNYNLNEECAKKIIGILNHYEVKYQRHENTIKFICPIHGSNKMGNATIKMENGLWSCWSGGCCQTYGKTIIGLIKGLEDSLNCREVSNGYVRNFIESLDCEEEQFHYSDYEVVEESSDWFMAEDSVPQLGILSSYYMNRKFSPKTLREFDIRCGAKYPWSNRSFVKVKYKDGRLMGFSARSHFKECRECGYYHSPREDCITCDNKYESMYKKWYHKPGSKFSKTLYGIEKITSTTKVALVEGPSCVWRLWEFGIPAVACLGKFFSNFRLNLLLDLGISKIMFIPDNDEAGIEFKESFLNRFGEKIYTVCPAISKKDVSDLSTLEIYDQINTVWKDL